MICKLVKSNSFGGGAYEIRFGVLFRIQIDDDTKGNLIIKNYRRGIFKDKLLYSFTWSKDSKSLIPIMIERLKDYTNENEKQGFIDSYWEESIDMCFAAIPK